MTISLIACIDINRGLGKDNDLLVKIPQDMKRFKELTTDNIVVMGRKTYESIGKPLPNRQNIIFTKDKNCKIDDCLIYNDIHKFLRDYENCERKPHVFIIGGEEIYNQFLPYAENTYLTMVLSQFEADTHFPQLNGWEVVDSEIVLADEDSPYDYVFLNMLNQNKNLINKL